MPGQYHAQSFATVTGSGREIKDSAHYTYISNGITLDGAQFSPGELVVEGQCLVNVGGKYRKNDAAGVDPLAADADPVILDTSVKFATNEDGENVDTIVGQALVHGAVHKGMLKDLSDAFQAATPQIRYVNR